MDINARMQQIVRENQQARQSASDRLSRLIDATVISDQDAINDILDETTGEQALGPDEPNQGVVGSDRGEADQEDSGPAGAESAG